MSKPFACKVVVSDSVTVRTTDNTASIVADQAAGTGVTLAASGAGKHILASADSSADVHLTAVDAQILIDVPGADLTIWLDQATQTLELQSLTGRIVATNGDFVVLSSHDIVLEADNDVTQTLSTITNLAILAAGAAANYVEFSNVDVTELRTASRLDIAPNAAGTTFQSLYTNSGVDNDPGRVIWIQNIGTAVGETLTLVFQSGTGTVGGLFFGPGDYVIPAGGGVCIQFDDQITADGAWLVRGV